MYASEPALVIVGTETVVDGFPSGLSMHKQPHTTTAHKPLPVAISNIGRESTSTSLLSAGLQAIEAGIRPTKIRDALYTMRGLDSWQRLSNDMKSHL
ncbi:hypothetical protein GOBAR_AA25872 [Gossypium barbadense]|uniref:Uncharacterized protein n=1 Tax=Gossypium barbadense TaxID=3634 RepID=A0A2P5WUL3_GOSBA|nr:hypothetical protein GOBAR_AA25872 [Gossypium barbadense]